MLYKSIQMKNIPYLLLICVILTSNLCSAQLAIHSFEEVEQKMKTAPKPIIVFIHTDWCSYCLGMKNTTFQDPKIITALNENFYFISLNAEEKKTIRFLNTSFGFVTNGKKKIGVHELAKELATIDHKMSYPTLTILNSVYEIIGQKASFTSAKELKNILKKITKNNV